MISLILTLVVACQAPDPFASAVPAGQRGELALPEGPAIAGPDIAVDSGGPSVPYPAGDLRAELLSEDVGPVLVRFALRHGLAVLVLGLLASALSCGVLGGYVARAKGRSSGEGIAIGAIFGLAGVVVVGLLPESRKDT